MVVKESLRLEPDNYDLDPINDDDSYIDLVTESSSTFNEDEVESGRFAKTNNAVPVLECSRYTSSYISVAETENAPEYLRFTTALDIDNLNPPPQYEGHPSYLMGEEMLYLSAERSLKATSLGSLLPGHVINQKVDEANSNWVPTGHLSSEANEVGDHTQLDEAVSNRKFTRRENPEETFPQASPPDVSDSTPTLPPTPTPALLPPHPSGGSLPSQAGDLVSISCDLDRKTVKKITNFQDISVL